MATTTSLVSRPFGATGEKVSAIGLGGSHLSNKVLNESSAIRLVQKAIDEGITFLDNSWDYSEGESERRMGKALQNGYRSRAFLMTKIDGRTAKSAMKQLEESLRRLKTDHVDLLQHHEVIRYEDADRIVAREGAGLALEKARKQGKCRFVGFTGHKDPHVHLYMMDRAKSAKLHFDAVQLPLNPMDFHFRSFERDVLPRLVKDRVAPLAMKAFGHGTLLKSKVVSPADCLRYALTLPVAVVITGIDSEKLLTQAITALQTFKPMTQSELKSLRARTREAASSGQYELFKTSAHYDATARNPEWLGDELPAVSKLAGD